MPRANQAVIRQAFGSASEQWITGFPALVRACVNRWQLALQGTADSGLLINRVYFGEVVSGADQGQAIVLKLGYPHPEQLTEISALRYYAGHLAPRLIDAEMETRALLMQRVKPGTTYRAQPGELPTLFDTLPRLMDSGDDFPTYGDWLRDAFATLGQKFGEQHALYADTVRATRDYRDICARYPGRWLLHGDLHHENILKDDIHGFVAIDPKGVVGPKVMECGRFLHNFLEDDVVGASVVADVALDVLCGIVKARCEAFRRMLGVDLLDLLNVAYVDCVLSVCWSINASVAVEGDLKRLDAVRNLLDVYSSRTV